MIEAILNRWRGTGVIFTIGSFGLIGNIIYAIYWLVLITFISSLYYSVIISLLYGLIAGILYIAGESFAWGKWIGHITDYDKTSKPD